MKIIKSYLFAVLLRFEVPQITAPFGMQQVALAGGDTWFLRKFFFFLFHTYACGRVQKNACEFSSIGRVIQFNWWNYIIV